MEQRTCERCGRANPRPKATICSRCKKSLDNAKHRGTVAPDPFDTFDCEWCGKHCTRGVDVPAHASRFCSVPHKKAWHRRYSEAPSYQYVPPKRWPQCRLAAQPKLRRFIAGPCAECGDPFVDQQWAAICCSAACAKRNQGRRARRRRAERYGWNDSNRARARRNGVAYEVIRVRDVFERDGYRCGICRKSTKRHARVPDPRAPTLDHIIPMSRGGPHLYVNVQCACFECNWRKRDGAANDQLLLVG